MSKRVLVVDDEAPIRELVTFRLETIGYEVDSAESGEQALEKIKANRPDLVVLDVLMPGIDGLETCKRLKADDPDIKVVMLSAHGGQKDQEEGIAAGADIYLSKPFRAGVLLSEIESLLSS